MERRNKDETLNFVRNIVPANVSYVYIRQAEALGLGRAVLCAKLIVGDEPFAVILADNLIDDKKFGRLTQMIDQFTIQYASILGVERVDPSMTASYGIVKTQSKGTKIGRLESIVDKPQPENAPSNLAIIGRYILTPAIFNKIEQTGAGAGGEIQLTDAIADLLLDERVFSYEFDVIRYDCGSKLDYLMATVEHGLQHQELKAQFSDHLSNLNLDWVPSELCLSG